MRNFQVVILAAGLGTRLGRALPKPLTALRDGRSILAQQLDNLREGFGDDVSITAVVGFKATLIMEAAPDIRFAYNEVYDSTNTCKSLLRALRTSHPGGVLWLNGDVVFDPTILRFARPSVEADRSFVCVNTESVAEEEVKYTVDADGFIDQLSKTVVGGLGEAVGINYVSGPDKAALMARLDDCEDQDYFERGIETAISSDGSRYHPLDISAFGAVEIDSEDDLARANRLG